jgi:alpha-D-xyloside xylohydrolase
MSFFDSTEDPPDGCMPGAVAGPDVTELAVRALPDVWGQIFGHQVLDDDSTIDRRRREAKAPRLIGQGRGADHTHRLPTGERGPETVVNLVAPGVLSIRVARPAATRAEAVALCLPAAADERFFGLGARFGPVELSGQVVENWVDEHGAPRGERRSHSPTPFLLSSRGYGLLVDTSAYALFDLRTHDCSCYAIRVEEPEVRLYLIAGPHPVTVLERHARLIGLPPLPPRWAFGVWKNLVGGERRVEREVRRLRDVGVPIDAVWIYDAVDDRANLGWPWPIHDAVAPRAYPDPAGLVRQLHASNLKVLGYLHPFVYPGTAVFAEAAARGVLVAAPDGRPYVEPWTFGSRSYVDFTSPSATGWWQDRVRVALTTLGFDGAMLDFGEGAPLDARYANGGSGRQMHNLYPVLYLRAAHEVGQTAKPEDVMFLARAGYSGSQPYTTARFTGDQVRSWDSARGMPAALRMMLNGSLSGWPYWGPDIAGFLDGGWSLGSSHDRAERRRAEKELWIRWVQLGALSPTMRDMVGAQHDPVGVWTDTETLAVFRAYARLHTALVPYLYRYATLAHQQGLPIMRPLFLNYPAEVPAYAVDDQYLLGDDILVAPVLEPRQLHRRVYLPAARWRDYWTGQRYDGPAWVTVPAPVHHVPLLLRVGASVDLPAPRDLELPNAGVRGVREEGDVRR